MDDLLSLRALARMLMVRPTTIRGWARDGRFPPPLELPGGLPRWRVCDVAAWLNALGHALPGGVGKGDSPPCDLAGLGELARSILQALTEAGGEWVGGADLARLVGGDADHTTGSWRRAVRELKQAGMIETDQALGYRLRPCGQD